jgi:hypothetical protein
MKIYDVQIAYKEQKVCRTAFARHLVLCDAFGAFSSLKAEKLAL